MHLTCNHVDIKIIPQVYSYDFYLCSGNNIEENVYIYMLKCTHLFITDTNYFVDIIASR